MSSPEDMPNGQNYAQVSLNEFDNDDDLSQGDDHGIELSPIGQNGSSAEHDGSDGILRISAPSHDKDLAASLNRWEHPWLLQMAITVAIAVPTLLGYTRLFAHNLIGRMWTALIFMLHLVVSIRTSRYQAMLCKDHADEIALGNPGPREPPTICQRISDILWKRPYPPILLILDIVLFGFVYPTVSYGISRFLMTDFDGTPIVEWQNVTRSFSVLKHMGYAVVTSRVLLSGSALAIRCYKRWKGLHEWRPTFHVPCMYREEDDGDMESSTGMFYQSAEERNRNLRRLIHNILTGLLWIAIALQVWTSLSFVSHVMPWPMALAMHRHYVTGHHCDGLDDTECALPFPSMHHMIPDNTTETGWRMHLKPDVLPPLRGGIQMDPAFLNKLDGASTAGPLLFYIDGMKEAYEARISHPHRQSQLYGHEEIGKSVTEKSITLLVEIHNSSAILVPHSAEIDYLDPDKPLVMIFPARPFRHNQHYALAVLNAVNANGEFLEPTKGMSALWEMDRGTNHSTRIRFQNTVLPALKRAAPWLDGGGLALQEHMAHDAHGDSAKTKHLLQLMFDFHTVSAKSQLGPIRTVRDRTMQRISTSQWNWNDHFRVIKQEEYYLGEDDFNDDDDFEYDDDRWPQVKKNIRSGSYCRTGGRIARMVHVELEVPWFLKGGFGVGGRSAVLDLEHDHRNIGKAKFVIQIPCSVYRATMGSQGKPMRAVVEFGHGLFFSRMEATDKWLQRVANDNGYVLIAMDWRGMSVYDLPVVVETLVSRPQAFEAVRDNLIQGYANKLALQHFIKHALKDQHFMGFHGRPIPTYENKPVPSVFYGISQGGILGAGYLALSSVTDLIDRGALNVPGSPFSLILSRSEDFTGYDKLLLLNFYNNRHVRILLSLVQMAWDPTEAAGQLALPITEPNIPPVLMQAGLGDAIVPTMAAEGLARALNASVLPHNPFQNQLYDIPTVPPNGTDKFWNLKASLTELLYEQDYNALPIDNKQSKHNFVHICTRLDRTLQGQLIEFINSGRVIDPCEQDGCRREIANCWKRKQHPDPDVNPKRSDYP